MPFPCEGGGGHKLWLVHYMVYATNKTRRDLTKEIYSICQTVHCFKVQNDILKAIDNNRSVILLLLSPVPELSFLPAPYWGSTQAGERRVQDNLHAHAQNAAIFSPKSGEKPYLEALSRFGLLRDFLSDNIQATISAFRLIKNMSINPKSVEFHQCLASPHSICVFYHKIKDNERNLCQDLLTIENKTPTRT